MSLIARITTFATLVTGNQNLILWDNELNVLFNVINGNLDSANVPDLLNKINDAPVDTNIYGRKDAAWVVVPTSSGGGFNKSEIFLVSGTWIRPAGVTVVEIEVIGAGGGGAGGDTASPFFAGGGGGGGGYVFGVEESVTGNISIAIGLKGTGGAANGSGNAGGNSQTSGGGTTTKTAGGGGAGVHPSAGGDGGTAVGATGDHKVLGQPGGSQMAGTITDASAGFNVPGGGGSAFRSPGAPMSGSNASGQDAALPGGGGTGGGPAVGGSGGDGANGLVILRWSE